MDAEQTLRREYQALQRARCHLNDDRPIGVRNGSTRLGEARAEIAQVDEDLVPDAILDVDHIGLKANEWQPNTPHDIPPRDAAEGHVGAEVLKLAGVVQAGAALLEHGDELADLLAPDEHRSPRAGVAGRAFTERCEELGAMDLHRELEQGLADHPKVTATIEWTVDRVLSGRHVLVFCVFKETQEALRAQLAAVPRIDRVSAPGSAVPNNVLESFRVPARRGTALALIVRDNLSESIDLDGGCPCVVHHDLTWNFMRLVQRWGRVVRASSGFEPVDRADIFIPKLDVPVDRRLADTIKGRLRYRDRLLPASAAAEADDAWAIPDWILKRIAEATPGTFSL